MSKRSEAVKAWRKRTKSRIVEAMGGKCYVCEYDKCHAAFDLHHIDPETKLFSLGGLRANPRGWSQIVEELRKCILLCATCHREVEDGFVQLKSPVSTFDESFSDYVWGERTRQGRSGKEKTCGVCDITFIADTGSQKYCSDVCRRIVVQKDDQIKSNQRQRPKKVQWPTKEELCDMMNTMSWVAIGKKYGVSDNAVRKWARKYEVI